MADIRTVFLDFTQGADMALDGLLLDADDGLTTALIISLFSDARASDSDALPHAGTDRRGWWADAFPVAAGDGIGSRLWLIDGKQTLANLAKAQAFAEAALAWLLADKIAARVSVAATNPRAGLLALAIEIHKPDGRRLAWRFETLWSNV